MFCSSLCHICRCQRREKKNHLGLHVHGLIFCTDFNQVWIFSTNFHKIHQYEISPSAGAALMQTEYQADMMKLRGVFRNYENAPENQLVTRM